MDKLIELFKYVILSIVQGVGEVLPISSSGHLLMVRKLFGIDSDGMSLEIILHLASLLALFIYYKKTIFSLIKGCFYYVVKKDNSFIREYKFVIGMIVSLIPTCVVGYFFDDYLDYFLKYSFMIGVFLVLNGINLYFIRNRDNVKKVEELSAFSFVKIGLGQCLGLVPGFSRSGSALSMCYREKMDKDDSEKFTFLMLFPLVLGSLFLNINEFSFDGNISLLIISFILTFMITLFSIGLFNKILKKNKLHYFSYYCVIIGILIILIF